jgi:hypothetical protein
MKQEQPLSQSNNGLAAVAAAFGGKANIQIGE